MDLNNNKIIWSVLALKSYWEEMDFIYNKWGFIEADKFELLVNDYLLTLSSGTIFSKYSEKTSIQSFVISNRQHCFISKEFLLIKLNFFYSGTTNKAQKTLKKILTNL